MKSGKVVVKQPKNSVFSKLACALPGARARTVRRLYQDTNTTTVSYESESCDSSSDEDDEIRPLVKLVNPNGSDEAAAWRKRVHARNAKFDELKKLGTLAAISCGSLLIDLHPDYGSAVNVEPFSNWKMVLRSSLAFQKLDGFARGQVLTLEPLEYKRLENSIRALGQMICLSVPDLEDGELNRSFSAFKSTIITEYVKRGKGDLVIESLKILSKICQALLLGTEEPSLEGCPWLLSPNGTLGPFSGQLSFISDIFSGKSPRRQFRLEEARALAQVSSLSRALPYPSDNQIRESVAKSVEVFKRPKLISKNALKQYREGVTKMVNDVGPIRTTKTHTNLSASSSYESTRSEGGRTRPVVNAAKRFCDLPLDGETATKFLGKFDCFGKLILSKQTYGVFLKMTSIRERQCKLGDLLYVEPSEMGKLMAKQRYRLDSKEPSVPTKLGDILNLTSSGLILEFGTYDRSFKLVFGVPVFDDIRNVVFKPYTDYLPVRAGISIESGLKSRLTTACPAAFVQLSQLVSNRLRDHLSKDPFVRVGFEEADKLWEVLKAYDKRWVRKAL